MKKLSISLSALALIAGLAWVAFGDDDDYPRRGGRWHDGMMNGGMMGGGMMGPGMMGGGMMGGMMGPWGWDADVPKEKAEQLDKLHEGAWRTMRERMYANRDHMITMQKAMSNFPIDEKTALDKWKAMNSAREEMFSLHLSTLAKAQQIVGKEKWEEMVERSDDGWMGGGRARGMMRDR